MICILCQISVFVNNLTLIHIYIGNSKCITITLYIYVYLYTGLCLRQVTVYSGDQPCPGSLYFFYIANGKRVRANISYYLLLGNSFLWWLQTVAVIFFFFLFFFFSYLFFFYKILSHQYYKKGNFRFILTLNLYSKCFDFK